MAFDDAGKAVLVSGGASGINPGIAPGLASWAGGAGEMAGMMRDQVLDMMDAAKAEGAS